MSHALIKAVDDCCVSRPSHFILDLLLAKRVCHGADVINGQ